MSLIDFKNNFYGGTRKNRFYIQGSFPGGSFTKFHITSAGIPSVVTKSLDYDHFGRKWAYPGEKAYENTWTFTVLDDYQSGNDTVNLWKKFQSWQNLINDHDTNVSGRVSGDYKADGWAIYHLGINGEQQTGTVTPVPLKKFVLNGCWPLSIGGIAFNMGNTNTLNTFSVTVHWDSIEIGSITTLPSGFGTTSLSF